MLAIKPIYPSELAPGGENIVERIGNTPLLRLINLPEQYGISPEVEIYAKAEWFNPAGSVKDRAAWSMIRDGERRSPGLAEMLATAHVLDAIERSSETGAWESSRARWRRFKVELRLLIM